MVGSYPHAPFPYVGKYMQAVSLSRSLEKNLGKCKLCSVGASSEQIR